MPWRAFISVKASGSRKFWSTNRLSNRVSWPPARWISPSPRCSCSIASTRAAWTAARWSPTVSPGRARVRIGTVLSSTPTTSERPSPSRPETVTPNTASARPVRAPRKRPKAAVRTVFRVTPWALAAVRRRSDRSVERVRRSTGDSPSVRAGAGPASRVGPGRPARCSAQKRSAAARSRAARARAQSSKAGRAGRVSGRCPASTAS